MKEKMKEEKISDALLKVALGYQVAEVTEEYAEVDGELKLTKRKKTKKDIPPDLKAVQLLLSAENDGSYSGWTDEQLQAERERLLGELQAKQEKETAKKKSAKKAVKENLDGVDVGVDLGVSLEADFVAETGGCADGTDGEKIVTKRVVKSKNVAGSVELNVKKPRPKPRKRVTRTAGSASAKKPTKASSKAPSKAPSKTTKTAKTSTKMTTKTEIAKHLKE